MKRITAVVLALMLALSLAGVALAEDVYERTDPEAVALFDSRWVSEDCYMDIIPQEGEMKVQITTVTDFPNAFCWEYSCAFDAENKALVPVRDAVKFSIVYPDMGGAYEITGTLYEEPVQAAFTLTDIGHLTWTDSRETALSGMVFEKVGRFDGTYWTCDRASVEMYYEEEGCRILIKWGGSYNETAEWEYSGFYDPDDNSIVTMPFGTKVYCVWNEDGTVASFEQQYDDGEAVFRLDADGCLIWEDLKEDAGNGMRFEQMPLPSEDADSNG